MSLFGELDVASASDNPFEVPPNTYNGYLTDVKVGPTKNGDKVGMTLIYTVDGGEYDGRSVSEWKEIPQPSNPKSLTAEEKRAASYLKRRLLDLGIPESRMNSVSPDDLIGTALVFTVKEGKNGYMNVTTVKLREGDEATSGSGEFAGFGNM